MKQQNVEQRMQQTKNDQLFKKVKNNLLKIIHETNLVEFFFESLPLFQRNVHLKKNSQYSKS